MLELDLFEKAAVDAVKERVREAALAGEELTCPVCGQFVKLYRRKFNSDMARALVLIARRWAQNGRQWVDIRDIDVRGGDYAKAAHWALLVQKPNDDPAKRTSGFWMPTKRGLDFARGLISIPSHVHILCGDVVGFSDRQVTFAECAPAGFHFQELMAGLDFGITERKSHETEVF